MPTEAAMNVPAIASWPSWENDWNSPCPCGLIIDGTLSASARVRNARSSPMTISPIPVSCPTDM